MAHTLPQAKDTYPLPLFIFLSLLAGWTILSLVLQPAAPLTTPARLSLLPLLALHIWLHWRSVHWVADEKRWLRYALAQAALVVVLAFLSRNPSVWAVLFIWLLGETVGLLDRPRHVALTLLLYSATAIGTLFAVLDRATALSWLGAVLPTAIFVAVIVVLYKQQVAAREEAQRLVHELAAAHRQVSDYAEQIEALTLANERQRMARELHDTLAQGVAGLLMQLEAGNAHLQAGRPERAQTILHQAMSRARTTLAEARAAIDDLRSQEAPARLSQRLEVCFRRFERESGLPCRRSITLEAWDERFPADHQEQLQRLVAEALTNIHQHAQATAASVTAQLQGEMLLLEIEDDGRGFVLAAVPQQGHYGLRGMAERVRLLGGTLVIDSTPGQGTTLRATMPLPQSLETMPHE